MANTGITTLREFIQEQAQMMDTVIASYQDVVKDWMNPPAIGHKEVASNMHNIPIQEINMIVKIGDSDRDVCCYNLFGIIGGYLCNDENNKINQYTGFLTLCNLFTPGVLTAASTISMFRSYGFELNIIEVRNVRELLDVVTISNKEVETMINDWVLLETHGTEPNHEETGIIIDEDVQFPFLSLSGISYNRRYTLVISSVLFLMMFKVVTLTNHKWLMQKWWKIFTGTLGIPDSPKEGLDSSMMPGEKASTNLCRILSAFPEIRISLFKRIIELSEIGGILQKTTCSITRLVKGIGLNHIRMILEFVINRNPELMAHPLVKPEVSHLFRALTTIRAENKVSNIECQYIKILLPPQISHPLNRENFPILIYLASKIRERVYHTIKNYSSVDDTKLGSTVAGTLNALVDRAMEIEAGVSQGDERFMEAYIRADPLRNIARAFIGQ